MSPKRCMSPPSFAEENESGESTPEAMPVPQYAKFTVDDDVTGSAVKKHSERR